MSGNLDLEYAYAAFEESTDFTVGLEEEFALLDPKSLELVARFDKEIRQTKNCMTTAENAAVGPRKVQN